MLVSWRLICAMLKVNEIDVILWVLVYRLLLFFPFLNFIEGFFVPGTILLWWFDCISIHHFSFLPCLEKRCKLFTRFICVNRTCSWIHPFCLQIPIWPCLHCSLLLDRFHPGRFWTAWRESETGELRNFLVFYAFCRCLLYCKAIFAILFFS